MRPPTKIPRLRLWLSRRGFWIEGREHTQGEPPYGIRFIALLGLLVLFALVSGALYGVLSDQGVLARYTRVDLAFLLPSLLVSSGLVLAGSFLRRFLPEEPGRIASAVLKGSGYALLAYVVFHQASPILDALRAELEIAQRSSKVVPYVDRLELLDTYALLFVMGVVLVRVSTPFGKRLAVYALSAVFGVSGFALMGIAVQQGFSAYASFYAPLSDVGAILMASFIATGLGIVLAPFGEAPNPILAGIGTWAGRSQLRNFTLGGSLATYFTVIRPALFDTFVYALVFEWVLVFAIAWRIYAGLRQSIGEAYMFDSPALPREQWQRHEQRIIQTHPEFLPYFAEIQREFLESGIKDRLIIQVTTVLWENGLRQGQIAEIVKPLVHYRDRPVPFPALPWETRWTLRGNARKRKELLDGTMQLLERFATEGQRFRLEVAS
ncbi:MAG: hypothetical protein HYX93_04350 [Chloroflexi bacterium]|nr:hypothetical protein [Chloroflexota bacterium]